jgi:hypothetical protein
VTISQSFATGSEVSGAGATLSSSTFDSTGFTHLVAFSKYETNNSSGGTMSDNKGSPTWTKLTEQQVQGGSASWGQLHYVKIGTPGTGHTVTMTTNAASDFRTLLVWLINATSGEIELVNEQFAPSPGATVDAGSLSNPAAKSIVSIMGVAEFTSATWTPGTGWTEDWDDGSSVNSTFGQSRGAETTDPIDPVCTASNVGPYAALAAAFAELLDTTGPVLSLPIGTFTGATTALVGATTNEGNGTMYAVVTTSSTQPSVAQIKAGQDHTGAAAVWGGSQALSSAGAKALNATGLTLLTAYYGHLVHADAAANDSNRVSSAQFTTGYKFDQKELLAMIASMAEDRPSWNELTDVRTWF